MLEMHNDQESCNTDDSAMFYTNVKVQISNCMIDMHNTLCNLKTIQ